MVSKSPPSYARLNKTTIEHSTTSAIFGSSSVMFLISQL